ncbi:MAG: HEAT repeat domain-containing protein [Acidimicrobiales bacterium]
MLAARAQRRLSAARTGHCGDGSGARHHLLDPDPAVRATALGALARLGCLTLKDLESGLTDPDPGLRRRACELSVGLSTSSDSNGAADIALEPLLADDDFSVAEVAAWAIGERQDRQSLPALIAMVTDHHDALCREAAVAALGAIGDIESLPAILSALSDKPAVRRRAVIALAPFDGPEVKAALHGALQDRDWQVRQAAEDLLEP